MLLVLNQEVEEMSGLLQVLDTALLTPARDVLYAASLRISDSVGQDIFDRLDGEGLVVIASDLFGFGSFPQGQFGRSMSIDHSPCAVSSSAEVGTHPHFSASSAFESRT
jgi:hypothetical protein